MSVIKDTIFWHMAWKTRLVHLAAILAFAIDTLRALRAIVLPFEVLLHIDVYSHVQSAWICLNTHSHSLQKTTKLLIGSIDPSWPRA